MKSPWFLFLLLISTLSLGQNIPQRGNLGVKLSPAPENKYGAIFTIADVSPHSTAASLGLLADDLLLEINGVLFDANQKIPEVIGKFVAGDKVEAKVLRKGKLVKLKGTVQARPPFKKANHELQLLEVPFREGYVRAYLTSPQGEGPFPTVYYLQDYPCQSINSHPQSPVLQLTTALVDLGYAVFRIEKPGVGEFANLQPCSSYSFDDEAENFENGLLFLQKLKQVDASRIYLFGHSLGGNVAPLLASKHEVAGVVTFGAFAKPWQDHLVDMAYYIQTYLEDAVGVANNMATLKLIHEKLYEKGQSLTSLTDKEMQLLTAWFEYQPDGSIMGRNVTYWQNFSQHNCIEYWARVDAPVLALLGSSDANAVSKLDAELIAQTVNQNHEGKASFQVVDQTNHLFAKVSSRPQEIENINSGMAAQVAFTQFNREFPSIIDTWISTEKDNAANRAYEHYSSTRFPRSETQMSTMDAVLADVNNDGHDDLILATEFGPNKVLLFDNGTWKNEALPQLQEYVAPYLGEDSEDIAVADFDKDGDLDLFFVSEDTKHHELLLNDGKGHYTFSSFQIPKKGHANAVMVYDFNQDGWEDVLIGIRGQNELYINEKGKGFNNKTSKYWVENADHTQDLILVDIDNDNDLDIIEAIEEGGNNLYINEKGKFVDKSKRLPLPEGIETRKVVAADFDQDGDMDLMYCNVGWNPVKEPQNQLLLNNGKGEFTNVTDWLPADGATTLDAAFIDLNNDGHLDIVTTNFVNDVKVKVFLGKPENGAYRFEEHSGLLPPIGFYGGTSVLPIKVGGEEYLYFANFKSEDILLKRKP